MLIGAIALAAVVVLGLAAFVGLRLGGNDSDEELVADASDETSEQADARAAECQDALSAGEGVTRVIDCGDGWAVLEREGADDPYWVTYRDGGWTTVNNDVNYVMTCDDALASGIPPWMAARYVSNCAPAGDPQPPVRHAGEQRPPAADPAGDAPGVPTSGPTARHEREKAPPPPDRSRVPLDRSAMEVAPSGPDLSRLPEASEVTPSYVPAPLPTPVFPAPEITRIMPQPPLINPEPPSKTFRAPRP